MKLFTSFTAITIVLFFLASSYVPAKHNQPDKISNNQVLSKMEQENEPPLNIQFTRVVDLDSELHQPISDFLNTNRATLPEGIYDFTVTVGLEYPDQTTLVVLIPTDVYESYWELPLPDEHIIRLTIQPDIVSSTWEITFLDQPEQLSGGSDYRFPWTNGHTWLKTQGFHFNSMGYSLDFIPNGNPSTVLSIESGLFTPICQDSWQAMVKVDHGTDESGYLHLDINTIPTGLYNQNIPRGQDLGDLYSGNVCSNPHPACGGCGSYQYSTPCGCGTATHLHFETNGLISIQGNTLESISTAPYRTPYTSTNSAPCCGCGLTNLNDSTAVPSLLPFAGLIPQGPTTIAPPPTVTTAPPPPSQELPTAVTNPTTSRPPDFTAPTGSLQINSGGEIVNSLNATLRLDAQDENRVAAMRFSTDGRTWTAWQPFTTQSNWQLANQPDAQTVYAQVKDEAGNISQEMMSTVTAVLSVDPPTSASYTVACSVMGMGGGTASSGSYTVNSTIGQPYATTPLQGSSYQVHPGFETACSGENVAPISHETYVPFVIRP